ncbi:MAG: PilZ domain-containing protein [Myxococcales bacterium]|nr:PilZ domain-containing protein [Myxococcales bacterium]
MEVIEGTPVEAERFHPRVEASLMVKLLLNGKAILATVRDLSMAGLCLTGVPELGRERVTVSIPLPRDREVVTGCTVRRRMGDVMALEFDQLDWEDLFALARFVHPRLP